MKIKQIVLFIMAAGFLSCSGARLIDLDLKGKMNITVDPDTMRTAVSGQDSDAVSFRIEGSHESGMTFETLSESPSALIVDLIPGTWSIRVRGYNSTGQVVAEGIGTMTVEPGGLSSMTVVLYGATGTGSLDFSLVWNEEIIAERTLFVSLKKADGTEIPFDMATASGSAEGLHENLTAGFYILEVRLLDGGETLMGALETVLIREGSVTEVNLDFTRLNKKEQRIAVSGESFTISWNYEGSAVDEYRLYYREHGTYNWQFLGSTESGMIRIFTIDTTLLPHGLYDMAVSSVSAGIESELHTSMDDTAVPATGWYIDWSV